MELSTLIGIFKWIFLPAVKAGRWLTHKLKLGLFRWQDKRRFFDRQLAIRLSLAALGGSVISARPFNNFSSPRQYLAVVRKEADDAHESRIHILERVGEAYTQIWASEPLWCFDPSTFEVTDIDSDGCKEVIFEESSFGTGAGTKCLHIYSLSKKQFYDVTEYYNFADVSRPVSYPVITAGDDESTRLKIITFAHSRGFLQAKELPDFDNPAFAVLRWHKENGDKRGGKVNFHFYPGMPAYKSSVVAESESEDIIWRSYFKGPLYGYCKAEQMHFIPYSPQWRYEWVKGLASDGNRIWFVCHGISGLFSFDLDNSTLKRYCGYENAALPEIENLSYANGSLFIVVANNQSVVLADIRKLIECADYCRSNIAHLSGACSHKKH